MSIPVRSLGSHQKVSLGPKMAFLTSPKHIRLANHLHRIHLLGECIGRATIARVGGGPLSYQPDYAKASFAEDLETFVVVVYASRSIPFASIAGTDTARLHDPSLSEMVRFTAEVLRTHMLLLLWCEVLIVHTSVQLCLQFESTYSSWARVRRQEVVEMSLQIDLGSCSPLNGEDGDVRKVESCLLDGSKDGLWTRATMRTSAGAVDDSATVQLSLLRRAVIVPLRRCTELRIHRRLSCRDWRLGRGAIAVRAGRSGYGLGRGGRDDTTGRQDGLHGINRLLALERLSLFLLVLLARRAVERTSDHSAESMGEGRLLLHALAGTQWWRWEATLVLGND